MHNLIMFIINLKTVWKTSFSLQRHLKKFWRKKNYGEFDLISTCSNWINVIPCWAKSVKESSEVADKAIFSPLNR